jgi:NOL1/NOP2/fmu family ribosome biogenesis protein
MNQLIMLNTREIKKLNEKLKQNFSFTLNKDYAFARSDKGKVYVVNKDLTRLNLKNLIIDRLGLYLLRDTEKEFRLSKEGAQYLFYQSQGKLTNVVELNDEQTKDYFNGLDINFDLGTKNKLIILKYKDNILGGATYKEGKILNFLPKSYRGDVII